MLRSTHSAALKDEKENRGEALSRLSLSFPTGWLHERPEEKPVVTKKEDSAPQNKVWLHCVVNQVELKSNGDTESAGVDPVRPPASNIG